MPQAGRRAAYRKSAWKRGPQRTRVYERDGYRCKRCGRAGKQIGGDVTLSLQHLIPERVLTALGRGPEDHELVTLCLSCHGKEDGGRRYANNGTVLRAASV